MHRSHGRLSCLVRTFLAAVLCLCWAAGAKAAEESSAYFLPDETLAVVRLPNLNAYVDLLRSRTKLGAVLCGEDRWNKIQRMVEEEGAEGWNETVVTLERFQLKPADLKSVFQGEAGAAVAAVPRDGRPPLVIGFAWIEPAPELADRLYAALQKFIEEDQQTEWPIRRIDENMAGHDVMRLAIAAVDKEDIDEGDAPDFDDEQAFQRWLEERARKQAAALTIQLDQINLFVTRRANRFLVATTFPQSAAETKVKLAEGGPAPNFDEISGSDQAAEVFGRFLAAHGGGPTGILPRVLATPGVAAALPDGDVSLELYADGSAAWKLLESVPQPEFHQTMESLGLKGIGPFMYRSVLDGNLVRSGMIVSIPAPRTGVLSLLDQEPLPAEVPAWTPASAVGYGHVGIDIGKVFELVKSIAIQQGGQPAEQGFRTFDEQCQNALQTDAATLFGSLQRRISAVSFEPELHEPGDVELPGQVSTDRTAVVIELKDENLWKRIIQLASGFAAATNGMISPVEEQGFQGLRAETPAFSGGLFVGQSHLVLAIGPGVAESVLASLRTPPANADAFRGGPVMAKAAELMPLEPGMIFQVTDNAKMIRSLRQVILRSLDAPFQAGPLAEVDAEGEGVVKLKAVFEKIKELIPSEEELDGMFGVSVGHGAVNQQGFVYRTVLELPAP